ncbi:hypothetical protein [Hymenobacter psoromatis]|nr:hypothetical protein [Hymenobacter psoromatis]
MLPHPPVLNKLVALLFILAAFRAYAQAPTPALDRKASATLLTYLLQ